MHDSTDHGTIDHSTPGTQSDTIGTVPEDTMTDTAAKNGIVNRARTAVGSRIPEGVSTAARTAASRAGDAAYTTGSWLAARKEDTIDAVVTRTTHEQRRNGAFVGAAVVAAVIVAAVWRRRSS